MDGMVIIDRRYSKSTFGANKTDLKQDKVSNANFVSIFLKNILMVRVVAHLIRLVM